MIFKDREGREIDKKVGLITCRYTGVEFINLMYTHGYKFDCVITISPEKGKSQAVAGYIDMKQFCEKRNIPCYTLKRYSMVTPYDKKLVCDLVDDGKLDLLISIDWQRIIPDWALAKIPLGVYGIHSTSKKLPYGRGRSPINWSLIQGKKSLFVNVFRYQSGADTGALLASAPMKITEHDTCHTLYLKQVFVASEIMAVKLPEIISGEVILLDQGAMAVQWDTDVTYPRRQPDDGEINWQDSSADIVNFIRAQTWPFPGAFSYYGEEKRMLVLYSAQEFDDSFKFNSTARPGEILHIFTDDSMLIKCGSGAILATEVFVPQLGGDDPGIKAGLQLDYPRKRTAWQLPE